MINLIPATFIRRCRYALALGCRVQGLEIRKFRPLRLSDYNQKCSREKIKCSGIESPAITQSRDYDSSLLLLYIIIIL